VDKGLIAKAGEKYGGDNRFFMAYDGKKLPFDDDAFDAVISFQVIEHVKDDRRFVSEARRVLKKGGVLILTTPNKVLRLPGTMSPWNVHHAREYSRVELETLLSDEFHDLQISGTFAAEEVMRWERSRIKRIVRIARYDLFNLRRLLPLPAAALIVKFLHLLLPGRKVGKHSDEALKISDPRDI
jgi:SAM-dependent methyltransferase